MTHEFPIRVYYEDTDLAGIVYYANYLKFIERARSELIRERGVDQLALKAETGLVFAVRRVEADYLAPARFDDHLTVRTEIAELSGARLCLRQCVLRQDEVLFDAVVMLAVLAESGRPVRLPADIRRKLNGLGG